MKVVCCMWRFCMPCKHRLLYILSHKGLWWEFTIFKSSLIKSTAFLKRDNSKGICRNCEYYLYFPPQSWSFLQILLPVPQYRLHQLPLRMSYYILIRQKNRGEIFTSIQNPLVIYHASIYFTSISFYFFIFSHFVHSNIRNLLCKLLHIYWYVHRYISVRIKLVKYLWTKTQVTACAVASLFPLSCCLGNVAHTVEYNSEAVRELRYWSFLTLLISP